MLGILKYLGMILLFTVGIGQTYLYRKVKKQWGSLPVVRAEILESQLLDYNDMEDRRVYEAKIRFRYEFRGEQYESETPFLKSPQIFPDKNIEHDLLARYKVGDIINARVMANTPKVAYLEITPFSKLSAIGVPALILLYALAVFGYGWLAVNVLNYESRDRTYEQIHNT